MSSLKTKFLLFANTIVLLSVIFISFFSIYFFYSKGVKKVNFFQIEANQLEITNIKSNVDLLERMLNDYLNGLKIIIDHLTDISKNLYEDDKTQRLIVLDKDGNILYDPKIKKNIGKTFFSVLSKKENKEKVKKFFKNLYPGADTFFSDGNKLIYVKSLKNFPYTLAIVKESKNFSIFLKLKENWEKSFKKSIIYIIISTIIFLIITAIFLHFISKPYFQLVSSTISILDKFSKGDIKGITVDLKVFENFKDKEIIQIKEGLNSMKEGVGSLISNIKDTVADINKYSTDVEKALKEILSRLNENNQTMNEQVKNNEEISSSILEMEKSLSEIKDFANANRLVAEENYNKASAGYEQMQRLTTWLNEVSQLSKKIDEIINVINDIAKKTKLLSLNASIEASKAGEYGKGFSVVAEEIRKLADSSSISANEISEYLKNINSKISEGISIANEIHQNLDEIRDTAKRNREDIEKVAVAIEQQHTSVNLISKNIVKYNEIVEVNQKNFERIITSVEQLEKTAKYFSQMADDLEGLMNVFKV